MRQEIIFARRQKELGQPPGWISVPLIVTSHLGEQQERAVTPGPDHWRSIAGEMSDTARVLFPVDENTACAALRAVYASRGQVAVWWSPSATRRITSVPPRLNR